ncbi:C45 family autoproteolytic acyltransferase/hydolase [Collinsella intestinalis]|uniref:C45 family autoproteolytic acyltransferase/hydolase n=1 Tax=Collinsella intestinalis TaxID=147207 RepID=UPI001956EDD5|nr:C45 family peptidase [Collinsella intestinalis]MBM6908242.1 linear amide C-N hydrolase [Collinsella intestinalis]
MEKKPMGRVKKVVLGVVGVLVALVIVAAVAVFALFGHELATLGSIEKVNDYPLYTMTYDGDYGIDEFIAQGGASNDGELIQFVVNRIMKGLPITIDLPDLACSTFNATTPEGDALFGRNFDLSFSPGMLVRTDPADGYASVSMVNLGFLGYGEDKLPEDLVSSLTTLAAPYAPLDGMNEAGLAVGVLLIDTDPTDQQTDKVDITTTTAIRMMLDSCATVDEAVALLEQYDMHSSANSCYHFQIADASGASVVVEYIGNEMSVLEPGDATTMGALSGAAGVTYQAATNFLLTPGEYDFGHGQDRYERLMSTLSAASGVLAEDEAMDLLAAVAQEPHLNSRGEESATQWSVVYNLDDLTASVVMGGAYDEPAYEVSLVS